MASKRPYWKCRELVERVTDADEGALTASEQFLYWTHLGACPDCRAYVAQVKLTREAMKRIEPEPAQPRPRDALKAALAAKRRKTSEES